jgi:hypothetical protein
VTAASAAGQAQADSEAGLGTTAKLAGWVSKTRFTDLPPAAAHATKRLICDSVAWALGARSLIAASAHGMDLGPRWQSWEVVEEALDVLFHLEDVTDINAELMPLLR